MGSNNNNRAPAQKRAEPVRARAEDSGTSLCFGSQDPAPSHRSARKRGGSQPRGGGAPDWMGGGGAAVSKPANQRNSRQIIDCSPPTSESEPNFAANLPAMSQKEFNAAYDNNEINNEAYGIGQRVLPDRHADKPLGGELEAGYGIGNRNIPATKQQQGIAGRRTGAGQKFALGDGACEKQELSSGDRSQMNAISEARMKSRPF